MGLSAHKAFGFQTLRSRRHRCASGLRALHTSRQTRRGRRRHLEGWREGLSFVCADSLALQPPAGSAPLAPLHPRGVPFFV